MKRLIGATLFGAVLVAHPASAQQQDYSVAGMQALLADAGAWMQDYQAVMTQAGEPMVNISVFVDILDRFIEGKSSAERAAADIEAWRARSLATVEAARAAAEALRPPPTLGFLGPDGAAVDRALIATRDSALPTIQEYVRVLDATAALGLAALRDPEKGYEARERALLQASMQLATTDRTRIDVSAASLPRNNPNQALMVVTQHYYDTLTAIPRHRLEEMSGRGDRAALAASLRQSSRAMRGELARADTLTTQTLERMRNLQGGESVELVRTMVQAMATFRPTIEAYQGLANNIDAAAASFEGGGDTNDIMSVLEQADAPHLAEIERLERVRAGMLANNRGTL